MSALDPLFQVWRFRADGGVITMSGTDGGLWRKIQDGGLQGFDDGVKGAVLTSRSTRAALEEGVTGEELIGLWNIEAAGTW